MRIAHGAVAVIAAFVPQQADPPVVAGALGKELGRIAVVAALIAQDADAAAEHGAKAERGALGAAQSGAPLEGIGFPGDDVGIVAAAIPQQADAARQAEALAPGAQLGAIVSL